MITKSTCFLFLLNWMLCLILKNSVQILNSWLSGKKVKPFVTTTNKTLERHTIIKCFITMLPVLVYKKSAFTKFICYSLGGYNNNTKFLLWLLLLKLLLCQKKQYFLWIWGFFSNYLFLMMETRVQRDCHWTIVTCLLKLERCGFEMWSCV